MKVRYGEAVAKALAQAPAAVQKAFFKQDKVPRTESSPSVVARKEVRRNQGSLTGSRNRDWRFYFRVEGDTYFIVDVIPHPK
jgi:hypothetical protein